MKTLFVLAVAVLILFAPMVGADRVEAGGLFDANSGERILDGVIAGAVVGGALGLLGEVLGGGRDHRNVIVVPGYGGYGHDGRGYSYGYSRGYNSGWVEGENGRRYRAMQRDEEFRRRDAIRAERAWNRGRMDGYEDARHRGRRR